MSVRPHRSGPAAVYRRLLNLYPRAYRSRFGDGMEETFLSDYARIRRAGFGRLTFFWLLTVTQAVWFGTRERLVAAPSIAAEGASCWLHFSTGLRLLRSREEIPAMVMALSVGVGLTVTAYSLIHPVLLTPLPYAEPDQLVQVWRPFNDQPDRRVLSYRAQDALARATSPFQAVAEYGSLQEWLRNDSEGDVRLRGARVSVELFDVLGVRPLRGRPFHADDARLADTPSVIVSERLVRTGTVGGVVDETIQLNGLRHRVIGVMPEAFWFPDRQTVYWVPNLIPREQLLGSGESPAYYFQVIARLTEGVTPAAASAHATAQLNPPGALPERINVVRYGSLLTAPIRPALLALQAASALVLLLVCLNVGWLFVARGRRVRQTFATMRALGASSGRVLSTHLVTAVVVAGLATPAAMVLAWVLLHVGLTLESGVFSRIAVPAITWHVVGVTAIVTALASFSSALPAALSVMRWNGTLTNAGRAATRGRLFERAAVVTQIGLVFAIAAQAVLFADVLERISRVNVGFQRMDFVVLSLERRNAASMGPTGELARYKNLLAQLDQRGVQAALTNTFPLTNSDFGVVYGRRVSREAQRGTTRTRVVTPSYFQITGIMASAGRLITEADTGSRLAVVTGTPAAYSGDTRRIGETVGIDSEWTIVGVVPPIRQGDFYERLLPEAYLLYDDFIATQPGSAAEVLERPFIVAETRASVAATLDIVRAVIASEMPDVDVRSASGIRDLIAIGLGPRRLVAAAATVFAGVSLLLAAFGLHGMVTHGLMLRGREIGIRMALGATPRRIAVEAVRPLAGVCGLGIVAGVALLVSARSALQAVMVPPPGVSYPSLSFVGTAAAVVLLAALALACYRPLRAAIATDPSVSLRVD